MLAADSSPHAPQALISAAVEEFCKCAEEGFTKEKLAIQLENICRNIEQAQRIGSNRESIRDLLRPAYAIHALSSFVQRIQTWPRGYPGDFETIEWIARSQPELHAGHRAYWIEWFALNGILGQQHRNKLSWQRGLMEQASHGTGRILNIGCGGCADLAGAPQFLAQCDFVLVDMDSDALALAGERLATARSLTRIQRNVIRGVQDARRLGPFDLILCGGLFDYLPARTIQKLVAQLSSVLADGGSLAFTNIGDVNPLKPWMEHLADWELIHRDSGEMYDLLSGLDLDSFTVTLEKDATGLTWLCKASRRSPAGSDSAKP